MNRIKIIDDMNNLNDYKTDDSLVFLEQGQELVDTFGILTERKQSSKEYTFVKNFLLGKSIELVLKSFLLSTNDYNSAKDVNGKFGNDLSKLATEASLYKNNTIVPVYKVLQAGDLKTIDEINKFYMKKETEDLKVGTKEATELGLLFDIAANLQKKVEEAIESNKRFSKNNS